MYENLTYEELKNLPEDKKGEAWGELHSSIPSNAELAKKLNVAPIAVVNAVKKYVLGEPIGRAAKKDKPESQPKRSKKSVKEEQAEVRPKRKYNRKPKTEEIPETTATSFSIDISNAFSGEEASVIMHGVGGTLLPDKTYKIEIKISEG